MLHFLSNTAAGVAMCCNPSAVLMQAPAVRKAIDEDIARHMAATSWEKAQVLACSEHSCLTSALSTACSILGSSLLLASSSCMSLTARMTARHFEWSSWGAGLHAPP